MRTTTAVGGPRDRSARARVASLWSMLQAMSPAILLGACYPIVGPQLGSHDVGGIPLSSLVVGVSVAVPWLSQVAGTPVYRLIGDAPYRGDGAARRFVRVWPALFALVLPPVLVVTALVALTTGWSATAMGAYIALALMNMLFVQSLVVADMGGSRGRWTLGWVAYAIALLIAPTIWILPPLAGVGRSGVPPGRGQAPAATCCDSFFLVAPPAGFQRTRVWISSRMRTRTRDSSVSAFLSRWNCSVSCWFRFGGTSPYSSARDASGNGVLT